jgi:hypothetical protein
VAPTSTLESPFKALAEEAHLLGLWVAAEVVVVVVVVVVVGAVVPLRQVDTVLDLMSTDPTHYRQLDLPAELPHLVEEAEPAVVDTAVDPTIRSLRDRDRDHQDPDDGVEEEVMEQAGAVITMPDAAVGVAVSTASGIIGEGERRPPLMA